MPIKNVLLEIGTEEIPSRFIPDALKTLKDRAEASLVSSRLTDLRDTEKARSNHHERKRRTDRAG